MTQLKWNPQAPKSGQKSYRFCKSEHEAVEVALPFPSFLDCPTAVLEDFVSKLVAVHGAEQNVFFVRYVLPHDLVREKIRRSCLTSSSNS